MRQEPRFLIWMRLMFGIIAAVVVSVLISAYIQRDNQIAACERNSISKYIDAQFINEAMLARRAAGDQAVAVRYAQLERAKRATIPMPDGWAGLPGDRGNSATDRREGCKDAFPPPIPWIE